MPLTTMNKRLRWRITWIAALVLCVATFTPLVSPAGTFEPELYGMPYTFWMGIVVTAGLVLLTYAATRLYPPDESEEE